MTRISLQSTIPTASTVFKYKASVYTGSEESVSLMNTDEYNRIHNLKKPTPNIMSQF